MTDTLTADFWPPRLLENTFLSFKLLSSCYVVTTPLRSNSSGLTISHDQDSTECYALLDGIWFDLTNTEIILRSLLLG